MKKRWGRKRRRRRLWRRGIMRRRKMGIDKALMKTLLTDARAGFIEG